MGTGSFPGVKRPGRGVDHPPPSSAEVKERVELYLYPPLGLRDLLQGDFYLYLTNVELVVDKCHRDTSFPAVRYYADHRHLPLLHIHRIYHSEDGQWFH